MGRIFIDGQDYTGNYLGAYPEAKNQIFDTKNSTNISSKDVQGAIEDLDTTIGDMSSINTLGTSVVEAFESLDSKIGEINVICDGVQVARVFETFASLETWLRDSANKGTLRVGNNLYIKELGVPDYWVSEVLEIANSDGYYYNISPLETQKVDLSVYDTKIGTTDISTIGDGTLTGAISDINSERAQLFQYVSDGKTLVANAITDRGVNTAVNAEFATIANNIAQINTQLNLQEKTMSLDTNNTSSEVTVDSEYDGMSKVTASVTLQNKEVTVTYGSDTIIPDEGKVLNSVIVKGPTNYTNRTQKSNVITKDDSGNVYVNIPANGYYDTTSKISVLTANLGNSVTMNNEKFTGELSLNSLVDKDIAYLATDSFTNIPYNFYYGSAAVYNNEIHLLGGSNASKKHYKYDGSSWVSVSTLPYNFYKSCAVVYNGEIHILGSYNSGYETNHYKYDGSSWTQVGTLPYEFKEGSAVVYNDEIHILGGSAETDEGSTGIYHYKWDGTTWTQVSILPYELVNGSAVVYNGEIHILGSYSSGHTTNHYKYDGSSWVQVSTIPYEFYEGSAVVHNNEIHIMGGEKGLTNHYKWNGTNWVSESTLLYEFYHGQSIVYDNDIYVLGGYGKQDCSVLKYSKTLAMIFAPYVDNQTVKQFLIS